ncbi:MAG: glycosyl hydrolase [Flavobacteriaceae bacterium]
MKKIVILVFIIFLSFQHYAQHSTVKNVPFTNIGPNIMSGRVVDIAVNPQQPSEFYVAYATGGLWHTNNNGISFTAVSDNAPTQHMGAIVVDWKNGTLWVGTGESNSSRSSYSGIGMLKSTDKGKTWTVAGLENSQHIGRVILDENNPDVLLVAVIGNLYTPNEERGVYKTTDGGKTWKKVLFIDENTGIIDLVASPTNSNIVYAAAWERDRKAWDFKGNGKHSGIYKSADNGETWELVSDETSGFPQGDGVGRIGLAVFNDNILYALLDNQAHRPKGEKKKEEKGLKKDDFKTMVSDAFHNLDNKDLDKYLKDNGFPKKYTAEKVKSLVKKGEVKPIDLALYLEDGNSDLFDTEVIGAELYKSTDGGNTWKKTHSDYLDDLYYTYGYYFGTIALNTSDENTVYIGGVPLLKSDDGGKTFTSIDKENVHADHQKIWVNPNQKGHIINGNDGGVNITYDDGQSWMKNNSIPVGQFYYINVDDKEPYNVYGGLQDNGVWYGPNTYEHSKYWESNGKYPYNAINGGDGMQVQIDNRDNATVYTGSQFGYYSRIDLNTNKRMSIHPKHELGETPYRYNWQTPILLSPHNQDILYMGANKLLRSMDKGENFVAISDDLTTGGKKGNVPYGTLTSISESPLQFGLIVVGTDDGYIQLTQDAGGSWKRLSDNLPQGLWVSRIIASQHNKNRIYATLNGYRNDDFKPYVYVSEDLGNTWQPIASNLPDSPVNVIKEDSEDESMLYLGNDKEAYVSFDKGQNWQLFSNGLPKVAVHDLVIQPKAKDLLIGTHGRSIYKANIAPLQQYSKIKNKTIALFDIPEQRFSSRWGSSWSKWDKPMVPEIVIPYYVNTSGTYTLEIIANDGKKLNSFTINADSGFNYFTYNLTADEKLIATTSKKKKKGEQEVKIEKVKDGNYYLPKGEYTIKISNATQSDSKKLVIK